MNGDMMNDNTNMIDGTRCPKCGADMWAITARTTLVHGPNNETTFQCNKCGHSWKAAKAEKSIYSGLATKPSKGENMNSQIDGNNLQNSESEETAVNNFNNGTTCTCTNRKHSDCANNKGSIRYGWVCPKCGAVMAPDEKRCVNCNGVPTISSTTDNRIKIPDEVIQAIRGVHISKL